MENGDEDAKTHHVWFGTTYFHHCLSCPCKWYIKDSSYNIYIHSRCKIFEMKNDITLQDVLLELMFTSDLEYLSFLDVVGWL